jgi:hypothetical protein
MQYIAGTSFLCLILFQSSIAMKILNEKNTIPADILVKIIRFAIAGQADRDDLTENGHYVCSDFVQYKNDQNRPIKPWIVNLLLINKALYETTTFILKQYHETPDQISNLVDFFCTHFQDSISKKLKEELPISIYLSKYILHYKYTYCNTTFNISMLIVKDCTTHQLLQKYQQDFDIFTEENKSLIDPDACSIKFHNNQLMRYYPVYAKLFAWHPFLPEKVIEFCLEKMNRNMSSNKEQDIITSNKKDWSFLLSQCLSSSDTTHISTRCKKVHWFLTKIFSSSQSALAIKIYSFCDRYRFYVAPCPAVINFILSGCNHTYDTVKDSHDLSLDKQMCYKTECNDSILSPTLVEAYMQEQISFTQFTRKSYKYN